MYVKGLHVIKSIKTHSNLSLKTYQAFKTVLEHLIADFGLQKLGEVYHNFSPEGFTAVICLSESHISVHTWPEHFLVNYDIYLSNYEKVNDDTVRKIDRIFEDYFEGTILQQDQINR
ncbi:S-adenosylmethionine decarboxylase family protein [Polluticaenibacter yanchengensis]|uniref:S-adenosylmethionine decarboxylase n=1 Tax=Polluticaenibacter yanchengensis TaxID=3014562 RepID=A0ABT4UEF6_9BACT|nr:S-adenosylmethionine decarboxylase [Chitinophagaceae bacterium LY-5]